eukprot:6135067-Amphidinium_carterae.1
MASVATFTWKVEGPLVHTGNLHGLHFKKGKTSESVNPGIAPLPPKYPKTIRNKGCNYEGHFPRGVVSGTHVVDDVVCS